MNHKNIFTLHSPDDERLWARRLQPNLYWEGKDRQKSQGGRAGEREDTEEKKRHWEAKGGDEAL